ncbi:unnamed protein product [Linum tenue]|uniref:MCM3-like winged helix domain-containing protein n=1 Tax=Linum tenue TaxID=586396 RepID=A0AAV0N0D0_9ROSI|nr:unnamed protein product [Linum tenue]
MGVAFLGQVTKSDVEAALKVLNFAIYHKELTDMEEREHEREREAERENRAQRRRTNRNTAGDDNQATTNADGDGPDVDAMDVDEPAEQPTTGISTERTEAFNSAFLQCMRYQQSITIDDLEKAVNTGAAIYSRPEIMTLLQKLQDDNRVMIADDGKVHLV